MTATIKSAIKPLFIAMMVMGGQHQPMQTLPCMPLPA